MGGFPRQRRVIAFLALLLAAVSAAAVFAVMAFAGSRHASADGVSNVKAGKFDAVDTDVGTPVCVTTAFADVPGMVKTFRLGGTAAKPVTVTYSGQVTLDSNGSGDFRLLVDGTQQGGGGRVFSGPGAGAEFDEMAGFTALTSPLSPGNHTVEIQFDGTAKFCASGPQTLLILHG
jgi:hypothetical protein